MTEPVTPNSFQGASQGQPTADASDEVLARIAGLSDQTAVSALVSVLERLGAPVDPWTVQTRQEQLAQALAQPEITERYTPDAAADRGELARLALTHLAGTDRDHAQLVERAITLTETESAQAGGERDPLLLFGIGALVLFAFHSDIELERDPDKGWRFHFKTKALSEATIGKLLGKLLGFTTSPPDPPQQ